MNQLSSRVGVVMTSYNYGDYVGEAIESVLCNNPAYVVVVDDCSEDNSVEVIGRYPVHLVRNERNLGGSESNRVGEGWLMSNVLDLDYIAICDSDDVWSVDKLEKQLAYMELTGSDFCFTHAEGIDTPLIDTSLNTSLNTPLNTPLTSGTFDWLGYFLLNGNCLAAPSVVYDVRYARAEGVSAYSGLPDLARYCWALSKGARIGVLEEELVKHRWHGRNASMPNEGNWRRNLYEFYAILSNYYPVSYAEMAWGTGRLECMLWVIDLIYSGRIENFLGAAELERIMKEVRWFQGS